jgi:hypothetical protein
LLVLWISVGLEHYLDAFGVPSHLTGLAINQLRRFLQRQMLPLRSEVVLFSPIMQVGEQDLQIEHDLVLFQATFSTKSLGINSISKGHSLGKLRPQLTGLALVLTETLEQGSLPFLKTGSVFCQIASESVHTVADLGGGLGQPLALVQLMTLLDDGLA